jgi:Txe/YoeB family toxin of Txe-Axe toxin-antitoxin module
MKPSKVIFASQKLEDAFNSLKDGDSLKKGIIKAMRELRQDVNAGIPIQKKLFPTDYIKKYGINNLWKYNLPNAWRLLYTVTPEDEIQLLTIILEWLPHKEYERRFGY